MTVTQWWTSVTNWFGTLNWGTVPDWFAAIGTVGALFLGFIILLNERNRQRRELAESFSTWWEVLSEASTTSKTGMSYELRVRVFNAGSLPIRAASLNADSLPEEPHGFHDFIKQTGLDEIEDIEPGEQIPYLRYFAHKPEVSDFSVEFIDGRGNQWRRNLKTGRYMKEKRWLPWWHRFKK